jgi:hypothetical protein
VLITSSGQQPDPTAILGFRGAPNVRYHDIVAPSLIYGVPISLL